MKFYISFILILSSLTFSSIYAQSSLCIKGRITENETNAPVAYASVGIDNSTLGTQTDEKGYFVIEPVRPGFYRLKVSCLGYKPAESYEFQVSTSDVNIDIALSPVSRMLGEVSVSGEARRKNADAPLSLQIITVKEIEKIPGANRDISKVVSSFAGVATPTAFRNDILVRGGGPTENRFYLDGIEIPNINHFSTQGASGGPVGILNADLIREVEFYSGAFPVNYENGVSSVLSFKLKDGNQQRKSLKFTLGASEAGISSNGDLSERTTYQVSARYSYLQFLFTLLKLPFLPRYVDGQFKIKSRLNAKNEISVIGIGAVDKMKLNDRVDEEDESNYLLYMTLPEFNQNTYTLGAVYKHYEGAHTQSLYLSNSYMHNEGLKYKDNRRDDPDMLRLRYRSNEIQTRIRLENISRIHLFKITGSVGAEYDTYSNTTLNNNYYDNKPDPIQYHTWLSLWKWNMALSASYESAEGDLTGSVGLRMDANSYSDKMNNPLRQLAPRGTLSYRFAGPLFLNMTAGRYYQMPAYTTMGFKDNEGNLVNRDNLEYFRCDQISGGIEYRPGANLQINGDLFYKWYRNGAFSIKDSVPIACLGNNYGIIGDEAVTSTAKGKAYGLEVASKWNMAKRLSLLASYTYVRSYYWRPSTLEYIPSSWDNKHLFTGTVLYNFPKNWDAGIKFRLMGGAPYTPYDTEASASVESWDALHHAVYDYDRFNAERLKTFTQLDIRVDKTFYWKGVMLGFYIDIQNILNTKYDNPDDYISTGVIVNPEAPRSEQKYQMKWIRNEGGNILPTLGFTIEI